VLFQPFCGGSVGAGVIGEWGDTWHAKSVGGG
jgi:hypothetical protein